MTNHPASQLAACLLTSCLGLSACGGGDPGTLETPDEPLLGKNEEAIVKGTRALAWAWYDGFANSVSPAYEFHERVDGLEDFPFRETSASGETTVTKRGAIGLYQVTFPHLAVAGGIAHVSAYGGSHTCKVVSWGPVLEDERVNVACRNSAGAGFDGAFAVLFYRDDPVERAVETASAYLWADNPTAASYTPRTAFNSRRAVNSVRRLGVGRYQATLPSMERRGEPNRGGTAQVTANGTGPERCTVGNWVQQGNDILVQVNCFSAGLPVDSLFTLTWTRGPGDFATFTAEDKLERFYVWADSPGSLSTFYQSDSYGRAGATLSFSAPNSYVVRLPNVKSSGSSNALVTAYGTDDAYCAVDFWAAEPAITGTQVGVSCYDSRGPKAAQFDLLYSTDNSILF
jgi:hypothetical protein